ncbi:hypothetical protein HII31_00492 [Pseudocercospora fuligena]|uniref:Uncharacterized protein n=1 Tax=Pseudocercospora fuligena TaxID=685502 RepID=A0A8H6RTI7_9PEZI|nr:hypothetical protein HII31_00492 [Pseudocercospora fuligena]
MKLNSAFVTAVLLSVSPLAKVQVACNTAQWSCPSGTKKDTKRIGERDSSTHYWSCIDACWYNEYKVRLRLKVTNQQERAYPRARWILDGKGGTDVDVYGNWVDTSNSRIGTNTCSSARGQIFNHPFQNDEKRSSNIVIQGDNGDGSGARKNTMANPFV